MVRSMWVFAVVMASAPAAAQECVSCWSPACSELAATQPACDHDAPPPISPTERTFREGQAALRAHDCAGALQTFQSLESVYREHPPWLMAMGDAHECLGHHDEALQYYGAFQMTQGAHPSPSVAEKIADITARQSAPAPAPVELPAVNDDEETPAPQPAKEEAVIPRALASSGMYGALGLLQAVGVVVALVGVPLLTTLLVGAGVIAVGVTLAGGATAVILMLDALSLSPNKGPMQQAVDEWKFPMNVLGVVLGMNGFSRAVDQLTRVPDALQGATSDDTRQRAPSTQTAP